LSTNAFKKKGIAFKVNHDFYEIPISNLQLGSTIIPWGGGGYFRFFPIPIFKAGVKRILSQKHTYMFYMHPWEIDPDQPAVNTNVSNWKHCLNLDKTYGRLEHLLENFNHCSFMTCSQYLKFANNSGSQYN
jgi:hypothetical protein